MDELTEEDCCPCEQNLLWYFTFVMLIDMPQRLSQLDLIVAIAEGLRDEKVES